MLTVDTIPLHFINGSLRLFVTRVASATATEFAEFQPVRSRLLVFGCNVVSILTLVTLKHNVVAWHN